MIKFLSKYESRGNKIDRIKFLSKYESRRNKIDRINSIRITKLYIYFHFLLCRSSL